MNTELIARLEAAEVGSWALDSDIFEALNLRTPRQDGLKSTTCPNVSESLDAAIALAERVLAGWLVAITMWHGKSFVSVRTGSCVNPDTIEFTGQSKTPALALCIAILRALDAQEQK